MVSQQFTARESFWWLGAPAALLFWHALSPVHAQQFVLMDETFTTTTMNTQMSQYTTSPLPGAPSNWIEPVDYTQGSVLVRFEILEKPSSAVTLCNVCFENSDILTCMPYPGPYTSPSVFTSEPLIAKFWNASNYNWRMPVQSVRVVLKDKDELIVQGDPQFYPSKMHITVTVLAKDAVYTDPNAAASDAGVQFAPMTTQPKPAGAGSSAGSGGTGGVKVTPTSSASGSSGVAGAKTTGSPLGVAGRTAVAGSSSSSASAGTRGIRNYIEPGSSCSISDAGPTRNHGIALTFALAAVHATRRAKRRRQSKNEYRH